MIPIPTTLPTRRVLNWLALLIFALLLFSGGVYTGVHWLSPALTQHHYHETTTEKVITPTIVQGQIQHTTDTRIEYVPKETIVYQDAVTGEQKKILEPTDIQVATKPPDVHVLLNGKDYPFHLLQGEKQKFEQGKLTLDQTSSVGIDFRVQPTMIDNTSSGGIEFYAGNKDAGIGLSHKRMGIDIGYHYKDKNPEYRLRWKAIQFK